MEILFQRDATSHDSGEFSIVHDIGARVVGEVFFYNFFRNPANASGNAGKSCCVKDCFHKPMMMMTMNKKSTQPGLLTCGRLQRPITAKSNLKCKRCSTSRVGCQIPRMKKPGSITDAELERRLKALREDAITGIINTTQMMDTSINPLSEEDRAIQIERVKNLIKARYPNAKFDKMVISFSKKKQRPMDIVILGPKGGETKVVLDDGSGLQSKFLNLTFVKKALGPPSEQIISQTSADIIKRQRELKQERTDSQISQQNLISKNEEIQNLD